MTRINRRTLIKGGAAAVTCAYIWIPRISIAQARGDAREAIIKSRTIVASNWDLVTQGSASSVAQRGDYTAEIPIASSTMSGYHYADQTSPGTEFISNDSGLAMFGGWHTNQQDHCHHYFHHQTKKHLAYVSTVPFIMKSYFLEDTVKHVSREQSIKLLYPMEPVLLYNAYLNKPNPVPLRVLCEEAVWICNYSVQAVRAGHGTFALYKRDPAIHMPIFEQTFDYDFT